MTDRTIATVVLAGFLLAGAGYAAYRLGLVDRVLAAASGQSATNAAQETGAAPAGDQVPEVTDDDGAAIAFSASETGTAHTRIASESDTDEFDLGAPVLQDGIIDIERPSAPDSEGLPPARPIQQDILDVVAELAASRAGLGYHLSGVHTEDIAYGSDTIRATGGAETMCVAAVSEIIIRAVVRWSQRTGDTSVFDAMTARNWMDARLTNARPWLYRFKLDREIPEYGQRSSSGARDAFVLFGIGESVSFDRLEPGDIIYFNRARSGHAAIFLGYLGRDFEHLHSYGERVAGFRYFSAQSSGVAGLGYRYAYFGDYCPSLDLEQQKAVRRDCGVIRSSNPWFMSAARLNSPDIWRTMDAPYFIDRFFDGATIAQIAAIRYQTEVPDRTLRSLALAYDFEIDDDMAINFGGETTD